ncbi:caspase family protein [Hydrogenophaga sp.]|uniref:caspase family protein n=1 Tax=Hydrogenophaga sp. TaxID=1904254 RepID=UPI0035680038
MASKTRLSAQKQAHALHVGLNEVSADGYAGWTGPLAACEFDAHDMAAIAKSQGMKSTLLLTKKATRAKVLAAIRSSAKALAAGDLFFLSYSGHGGQVPDVSGDEADKQDETWCLYDAQLIDDELYFELSRFKAGVRVLVISDSCHSGTVVRAGPPQPGTASQRPKLMPPTVARRVYSEHQAFYDKLQLGVQKASGNAVLDPDTALAQVAVSGRLTAIVHKFNPTVILMSGCQDNQFSMDGDHNGAFTEQLLKVWNHGQFKGSYASLHARVLAAMPPAQSPNLFTLGSAASFLKETPFLV